MPERLSRLRFGIRFISRDACDARDDEDDDEPAPTAVSCLPGKGLPWAGLPGGVACH